MIEPKGKKNYYRLCCVIGLMVLTTISLSDLAKPSYAILTSTSLTKMTFSAADYFPQSDMTLGTTTTPSAITTSN